MGIQYFGGYKISCDTGYRFEYHLHLIKIPSHVDRESIYTYDFSCIQSTHVHASRKMWSGQNSTSPSSPTACCLLLFLFMGTYTFLFVVEGLRTDLMANGDRENSLGTRLTLHVVCQSKLAPFPRFPPQAVQYSVQKTDTCILQAIKNWEGLGTRLV